MMEFKVDDYVILSPYIFGKIAELKKNAETGHVTAYIKTLGSQYVCSLSSLKKIDMDKFERLIQECVVDEQQAEFI